jgi:hypothetical protein
LERAEVEGAEEGGRRDVFVWPREEDEGDADESAIVRAWTALASGVMRLGVDGSGRVRDVEVAVEPEGEARALLGLMSPHAIGRTLAPVWAIDTSGEARDAGETWADRTRMVISGERVVQRETTYVLDRIEGETAVVTGTIEYEALPIRTESIVEAEVRGVGGATIEWDVARGILSTWDESSEITLETSLGEGGPGVTTRVVRTLRLTRLEDDS